MNISEIKEELQRLGISTSTPGLVGDERYEELKFRLEQVGRKANLSPGQKLEGQMKAVNSSQYDQFSQLTIGELRTRLTSLGISTSTPGVTGEERWSILMQRLMDAICVKTNDDEEEEDSDDDKPPNNKALEFIPPPKQPSRKPVSHKCTKFIKLSINIPWTHLQAHRTSQIPSKRREACRT